MRRGRTLLSSPREHWQGQWDTRRRPPGRRRGLAPLELVLALPILMMLTALMVGLGARWCWKIRGYSMARHAAWSSRYPRSVGINPRPDYWPADARASAGPADDAPGLDNPLAYHLVVRSPGWPAAAIPRDRLNPTTGFIEGTARFTVDNPMLRALGKDSATAHVWLLDDQWQYPEMGLSNTQQRRIPVLYALAKAPANLAEAYLQTAKALLRAPFRPQLEPLDNDDEYRHYGASTRDFHPSLDSFDSLDPALAAEHVQDLIDRIQGKVETNATGSRLQPTGVPVWMANSFISLYREVIAQFQRRYFPDPVPPAVAVEIAALQTKIEQFEAYRDWVLNNYVP